MNDNVEGKKTNQLVCWRDTQSETWGWFGHVERKDNE